MTNEQALDALKHLLGQPYVSTVKTYIAELTGRPLVAGPMDPTTQDINPLRIRIAVNNAGEIDALHFN